ncbi:VOC family protein [Spongiibacter sp. KMU-158]|uniref:VOC family protein n=1 Tax=Spongiibacter pelagi TaxID=2760804 RepID=A0A927BYU7_9GAMM|nr:VOC family protein [Spongiibacter pelagi]MBD2858089.1 VOC family protein [Spongiibacter pelagi]
MGYHHLALAAKDMKAIHEFYEGVMQFELVKVEIAKVPDGGWAKHFFYRMEDDSKFIAFWEMHDVPGGDTVETNISRAAGVPDMINHISFDIDSMEGIDKRRQQWLDAGLAVMEVDHDWCYSIYTKDPNDNLVEFCLTTGAFTQEDREFALKALSSNDVPISDSPGKVKFHAPSN